MSLHDIMQKISATARHMAVVTLGKCGPDVRSRINIENTRQLKQSGFTVGAKFQVEYQKGIVEIKLCKEGSNCIAPKRFSRRDGSETLGERLDLRSRKIAEQFDNEEKVLVVYLDQKIIFMHLPTVAKGLDRVAQLAQAVESGSLRTAAFYAGIGTLDAALHEGFEKAGMKSEIAFANDSWSVAVDGLLNDNPAVMNQTVTFTGGIEQFIASGRKIASVDMAIIGIPCKGASKLNIGSRDLPELHPWAGHQVLNAVMALQQMNFPPLVLIENVTAYANTASCSMITRVLEEQGYQVDLIGDRDLEGTYKGINSNDYGDIEKRVRMALLAYPKGVKLEMQSMVKTGPSMLTVGDIRLPDEAVDASEYEKGLHLNRACKVEKGWRNRIVNDDANSTPSLSADCWKQRIEDPKFKHQSIEGKCRLPTPDEHAKLKGHDPKIINSITTTSHAHTALGNGTAKKCWVEFARTLASSLKAHFTAVKNEIVLNDSVKKPSRGQLALF